SRRDGEDLAAVAIEHVGAKAAIGAGEAELVTGDELDAHVLLHQANALGGAHPLQQGALDLAAGEVLRVEDATPRVAALTAEIVAATIGLEQRTIEGDAERAQALDDARTGL